MTVKTIQKKTLSSFLLSKMTASLNINNPENNLATVCYKTKFVLVAGLSVSSTPQAHTTLIYIDIKYKEPS